MFFPKFEHELDHDIFRVVLRDQASFHIDMMYAISSILKIYLQGSCGTAFIALTHVALSSICYPLANMCAMGSIISSYALSNLCRI